ncbi:MurR/RpiR family transcriptional regulator [uncultured Clostridium sp.]|jgi:DNA-binding MurR/RpiR family transcriptional regulator|uniref:MurR/RpiR family transcriptional regulator n=1 Tax=uncultured Clostridium sp. TaxID=59620 RepID=UPI0028E66EB9|nr:MurR/RpiR family transcriptional regulator [uncultured Clostridium sp.]
MIIERLKNIKNLTVQEKSIVDYILNNPEIIIEVTAEELAGLTYTSSSTVVRLCKKLGTNGYPDFRFKYAMEYKEKDRVIEILDSNPFNENSNLTEIIDMIPMVYEKSIRETKDMLDKNSLARVISLMKLANKIDIYGVDINNYIAEQACCKLNGLGINATAYNSANIHYINSPGLHKNTLAFIISHTGNNRAMIEIAKALRSKKIKSVAICGDTKSELSKICDESIFIFSKDNFENLSKLIYVTSTQYIFDILFTNLAVEEDKKLKYINKK